MPSTSAVCVLFAVCVVSFFALIRADDVCTNLGTTCVGISGNCCGEIINGTLISSTYCLEEDYTCCGCNPVSNDEYDCFGCKGSENCFHDVNATAGQLQYYCISSSSALYPMLFGVVVVLLASI